MDDKKIKFRQNLYFELTEKDKKKYTEEKNKSDFVNNLIEEHFNPDIVKVKIDPKIKEAYENDIYKEFRIEMLLLDFYLNKKNNFNEISMSSYNEKEEDIVKEEFTSSENKKDLHVETNNLKATENLKVNKNDIRVYEEERISNEPLSTDNKQSTHNENGNILEEEVKKSTYTSSNKEDISNVGIKNDDLIDNPTEILEEKKNKNSNINKSNKNEDIKPKTFKKSSSLGGSLTDIMPMNNKSLI